LLSLSAPRPNRPKKRFPRLCRSRNFYVSTFYTRDFHLVLSPWTLSIFYVVARMWPLQKEGHMESLHMLNTIWTKNFGFWKACIQLRKPLNLCFACKYAGRLMLESNKGQSFRPIVLRQVHLSPPMVRTWLGHFM